MAGERSGTGKTQPRSPPRVLAKLPNSPQNCLEQGYCEKRLRAAEFSSGDRVSGKKQKNKNKIHIGGLKGTLGEDEVGFPSHLAELSSFHKQVT